MNRAPRHQDLGGAGLLFFTELVLILGCFYAAAVIDLEADPMIYFAYEGGFERLLFAVATIQTALYFRNLYSQIRVASRVELLQELCAIFGLALVSQSLIDYLKPAWILPRWLMIYGAAFSLAAVFAWRLVYSHFFLKLVRRQRIVFVGRNSAVEDIAFEIANTPERGYEILGFADDSESLRATIAKAKPDRIVVGMEDRRQAMPIAELLQLRYSGMAIEEANITYEDIYRRVCARELNPLRLIFSNELRPAANALLVQRVFDRILSFLLLTVSAPVMFAVAIGLRMRSPEPVLVRTAVLGKDGKLFNLLRFRRGRGLGSLYRRLHLDAMPELLNVLRGEMALVGPRAEDPDTAAEKANNIPLYDYRHNVQPGMTGWAQINLESNEQRQDALLNLEYDLYYIKHVSQALNTYILMTTVKNRLVWADRE